MSFPGRKRPFYTSSVAVLLILSLTHIWISSQSKADAIRIFPQRLTAAVEEEEDGQPVEAAPPGKNQTEIFKEYFNSRLSDLNTATNGTYADYKRRIPSCPDPLHN